MEGLNILKMELLKQKELIESMSGTVTVAKNNPSPSEITAGIKTIQNVDLSLASATEADVVVGKTFYSQNNTLKTGTLKMSESMANAIFMPVENVKTSEDKIQYEIPQNVSVIKHSAFRNNKNNIQITLHNQINEIEEDAFLGATNFEFVNFSEMESLKKIGKNAFKGCGMGDANIGGLPSNVEEIGDHAFYDAKSESVEFKFPNNLKVLGDYVFGCSTTAYQNTLDLSNYTFSSTKEGTFYYNFFDCDFTAPPTLATIGKYFNYNGGFNNIIIPETVTLLDDYCFGADASLGVDYFYTRSITFLGSVPPQIGVGAIASQHAQRDFKIYVPDGAVETYKQVENLSEFVNQIYPISQKV